MKDSRIAIRVTEEQRRRIQQCADDAGLSVSAWVRVAATRTAGPTVPTALLPALRELARRHGLPVEVVIYQALERALEDAGMTGGRDAAL